MNLDALNQEVIACTRCPRLREWCLKVAVEKRKSFAHEDYWGLPVPSFGDPAAARLIVGLAPAAHGANRTGRMFTGDRSGDWLYRAMFRAGLANQSEASNAQDGLKLKDVIITAVNHCAPPDNKPTTEEMLNCRVHLEPLLKQGRWKAILCLGGISWTNTFQTLGIRPIPKFSHGIEARPIPDGPLLIGSYHPSQQNTFTGRLTEAMLDEVMTRFSSVC